MTPSRLVYIVDDTADYRFLVQQVVKMFLPQHQLVLFADGADLIGAIDAEETQETALPDVIALDVDMPRLNGFQTLVHLKQRPQWQSVPVIIITNRDDREFRQEGERLGASAFMLKPLDLMGIKTMVTLLYEHEGDFTQLTD